MNIAITLPFRTCANILTDIQTVLLYTFAPTRFDCLLDKVYVICKGSHNVVMTMTIKNIVKHTDVSTNKSVYVWTIGIVSPLKHNHNAAEYLGIYHNPTTFKYVYQA